MALRFAIKDNFADGLTTCGSQLLKDYQSPITATVCKLLKGHKMKVNMDEFGMGSYGIHSGIGDKVSQEGNHKLMFTDRVVGGSSSGCASAVAQGLADVGVGTDTGGSIRLPAAYNKLYGFKPSYGRISRYGVVPYAHSLDTVGLLSNKLDHIVATFKVLDVFDPLDSTAIPKQFRLAPSPKSECVVGIPKEIMSFDGCEPFLKEIKQKYKTKEISIPHLDVALACYYVVVTAEAYSSLAKYSGLVYPKHKLEMPFEQLRNHFREQFGKQVKARLELGAFVLGSKEYNEWFLQAARIRRLIQEDFSAAFKECAYIAMPTTLSEPPTIDVAESVSDLEEYYTDTLTVGPSLAGLPVLCMPFKTPTQLIGRFQNDRQLLLDFFEE